MHQAATAPKTIIPRAVLTAAGVLAAAALVLAVSDRPAFAQGPYEVEYPENGRGAVAVFTAQDPEGDAITWTLGGTDAEDLSLSSTGVLSFKSRPDYESPDDDGGNNAYEVTVSATDGGDGHEQTATVTVTVTNVDEAGVATLPRVPEQAKALQAELSDPDHVTDGTTRWQWAWSTSSSSSGTWTDIPGATADTYTPKGADVGRYLRATATYDDRHGAGKTARVVSAAAVATKVYAAPEYDTTTTRRIAEDASAGDAVGAPVVARHNANDVLTYTMARGDTPADYFTINRSTGQISVGSAAVLDHDVDTPSYTVTVTATDPASKFASTTVTIQVTNVDEPPKDIASTTPDPNQGDFSGCSGTTIKYLREGNTAAETSLCEYTATDPEGNTFIEWSLAGADAADFHISNEIRSEGQLSFRSVPDYENPDDSGTDNTYNVTVRASDRTGNVASLNLIVGVENAKETGEVTFSRLQPAEGVEFTAKAVDPDGRATRPRDDNLTSDATWKWERCEASDSNCSNPEHISGATSATYTPVQGDVGKWLRATASYTDAQSGTTTRTPSKISEFVVLGANSGNRRPEFDSRSHTFTIPENTLSPTSVGTVAATDPDGIAQKLTYALSGSNASLFQIAANTGQIKVGPDAVLNYESGRRSYSLSVQATDPFGLTANAARVTINVTNEPEAPVFDDPDTLVYYKEHGQGPVATYDADDPERSTVIWALTGDNASDFSITQRGVLSFDSPPTYSCTPAENEYSVTITASDGLGTPTPQPVKVRVENVEDAGVVGLSSLLPQEGIALTASLTDGDGRYGDGECSNTVLTTHTGQTESQTKWQWARSTNGRTWVDIVEVSPDHTYTPVEEDVGKFLRATASYRDNLSSDYEIKTASQVSANKVRIRRYTAPVFESPTGTPLTATTRTVTENAAAGSAVGAPVSATHNAGQVLTYALAATSDAGFTIDSGTGQIRVAAGTSIDHETTPSYTVTVQARDADPTPTEITVTISVTDVNEYPAVITGDSAVTVVEKTPASNTVHDYGIRSEQESNEGDDIKWTLSGADADDFTIDGEGILKFKHTPNYEAPTDTGRNNRYSVKVEATDDEGKNAYLAVTVTVTNVEEAGEVTLSTVQPEVGTSLSASLADPDGVVSGTTSWQWSKTALGQTTCPATAPDENNWTDIASATSARYTPVAGDATSCLRAVATYRDRLASGREASSLSSVYPVQARDTSNQPPVFPNQNAAQTITVAEDSTEPLSPIVKANDEGGQDNLTYTLSGTDAASFAIVRPTSADNQATAGQLSVASGTTLDYESKSTYRVTVKATDPSGKSASVAVTIKVTNVNEPPALTLDSFVVSGASVVDYPETTTGSVGTYTAAGTKAAGVTWSLSGTDSGDFRISTAGVLTFASQPNFESPADSNRDNEYEVTVRARNSSGNFALRDVTVSVGNVDEPGRVSLSRTRASIGTALTASLTDPDGGVSTVAWRWSRSLDGATRFTNIAGANSETYTPVQDDLGKYLRATASYPDAQGTGKSASTVTASAVTSLPDTDGRVALSTTQPTAETSVTATLSDPDTPIANLSWLWESAAATAGPWSTIIGAVASSYTPVDGDIGRYLRVTASYDDARGTGKTASATSSNTVRRVQTLQDRYDANGNGQIDRSEAIQAINDYLIAGTLTRAETLEVIRLYLIG